MVYKNCSRRDWIKSCGSMGLFLSSFSLNPNRANAKNNSIDIGSKRELFVDDYLIDKLNGAKQQLHHPIPREIVMEHDLPWEGNTCYYHTIFRDDTGYRLYYRGSHALLPTTKSSHQVACMAESPDGIHWTKPNLGLIEFNGSRQNNIIWDGIGSHNFVPFKDSNPDCDPQARYKAVGGLKREGGLYAFKSPDGIHWSLMHDNPIITKGAFDSQNLAFWDARRRCYVDFHRGFRNKVRDIMTCTSKDFIHWTDPVYLEYPNVPPEHLYINQIVPYHRAPHIYLGFPKRFLPQRPATIDHPLPGVSDSLLMSSRDGNIFHRWQEAFIRPGIQQDRWVCRNNPVAWGLVETQNELKTHTPELSLYVVEGYYQGRQCRLRRYTLRLDGFVSVYASMKGGELVTKPIRFSGNRLNINFSTSAAGSVQVELQDRSGHPISGYKLDESNEIYGDAVEHTVTWKKGPDVSRLAGKPIRLRFVLKDADVFAFRFVERG